MKFAFLCIITIICMVISSEQKKKWPKLPNIIPKLKKSSNSTKGDIDLRGKLREKFFVYSTESLYEPSNVICSPLSALMPLGKLALGAVGKSLGELLKAIGISSKDKINRHFKPLIAEMRYLPGVKLEVASKLYVYKDIKMNSTFRDNARDTFQSSVDRIDFGNANEAAAIINSWVSKQTNNKIQDMVDSNDLSASTVMVIVNAVYFEGTWIDSFTTAEKGNFFTPKGKISVNMMQQTSVYNFTRSAALGARIVKIPYTGNKAYFLLVLPERVNGLPKLLRQLQRTPNMLNRAMKRMAPTRLSLKLPPFRLTTTLDLGDMYKKLGVHKIFDKNSGLDDMVRDVPVSVTKATHKAFIEVSEKGTVAAASSSAQVAPKSPGPGMKLHAEHPFLYFIIVEKQQLFAGTLVNPNLNMYS